VEAEPAARQTTTWCDACRVRDVVMEVADARSRICGVDSEVDRNLILPAAGCGVYSSDDLFLFLFSWSSTVIQLFGVTEESPFLA
jgi:hypothetical protein